MKGKRTGIEFDKHELIITKNGGLHVHHLKVPDTLCRNIEYINIRGMLIVTGDFGDWMFCREFTPHSTNQDVSDSYWIEKLEMSSTQKGGEYSPEDTQKEIERKIDEVHECGYSDDDILDVVEYYYDCKYHSDSEWEYVAYAHGSNKPNFIEHEDVPFVTETKHHLLIVFDGFEEICRRLRESELKQLEV